MDGICALVERSVHLCVTDGRKVRMKYDDDGGGVCSYVWSSFLCTVLIHTVTAELALNIARHDVCSARGSRWCCFLFFCVF